jgi:hypothetical protein
MARYVRPRTATGSVLLIAVSAIIVVGAVATAAGSDESKPLQKIPRIDSEIVIDGVLDEPIWERALVMGVNNEVRPGNNIPAPVQTDMLLAYSETHFYVAFRAFDPDPARIYAHLCDHDRMWDDEWVVIGVDTYNDQRGGYEFACNPLGIQGDTASGVHGEGNSWDAIWDSAGKIFDWGYSVEMAIPFNQLRFQQTPGEQIWGVDAVRSYPRDVRHHISLYERDRDNNCYRCQMDRIVGFEGVTRGKNLEIKPSVSAFKTQERLDFPAGDMKDTEDDLDVGVSARWGITPNVTFATAINPDFSQVEADAFQLDVNRTYALSYEEKRPFFLESAGVFNNFYSRSIASPIWATKLTGKTGDHAIGVLVAEDEMTNLIISGSQGSSIASLDTESTATALRYQLDVGQMSNVSAYYNGRESGDYHNRTGGVRGEFWPTENVQIRLEAESSYTQYPEAIVDEYDQEEGEFSAEAYDVYTGYFSSGLDVYANYSNVGDGFRTDLSFMPRVGYRHTEVGAGHMWQRESGSWWTMLNFGNCYTHEEYQDGTAATRGYNFWFNYQGPRQSTSDLTGWLGKSVYEGREFDTWELNWNGGFWPSSSLLLVANVGYGEDVDYENVRTGHEFSVNPYVELKLGRGLSTTFSHTYERFNVEGEELYTANISYLKAVYQFNRRMFVRALLQYSDYHYNVEQYEDDVDPEYRGLMSQVLLSYKLNPHTVFFVGYSDSHRGDQDIDITQDERTVFAKIGYAWVL